MPKYEVTWKELRYVWCSTEVEADNEEEAIEKAQAYEEDTDKTPGDCFEQYEGFAKEIED